MARDVAARRRRGRAGASSVAGAVAAAVDVSAAVTAVEARSAAAGVAPADTEAWAVAGAARFVLDPVVRRAFGRAGASGFGSAKTVGAESAAAAGPTSVGAGGAGAVALIGTGSATASPEPGGGSSARRARAHPKGNDSFRVVRDMRAPVGKCPHRSLIGWPGPARRMAPAGPAGGPIEGGWPMAMRTRLRWGWPRPHQAGGPDHDGDART